MRLRVHPAVPRPVVAAIASGRLERNTATSMATLTEPAWSTVRPSTSDSGIPSSTIPRTMASGDPASWAPLECLRAAPPIRSISASPTKKTAAPTNRPTATPPSPSAVSNASSTSSKATALIRTPAPKAMIRPSGKRPIRKRIASTPPIRSEELATNPQNSASAMADHADTPGATSPVCVT